MRLMLSPFVFVALLSTFSLAAIPTDEITTVREKAIAEGGSVSASDRQVIDKFVQSAIDAMFLSDDSAEVTEIRQQIRRQKGTQDLSMYASTYLGIVRTHLRTSFEAAERIQDAGKKKTVVRNLVILAAEMKSLMLAEFGLSQLDNPDIITRYWAVKCIAGSAIVEQLNSDISNNPETAAKIYEALSQMAQNGQSPEIFQLLIEYAGGWNDERAAELLTKLTQGRIEKYQNWTVKDCWLEIPLLKALAGKYETRQLQAEKAEMVRMFAELYSLVLQRWMLGQDVLTTSQKDNLISVIVEVDQNVLESLGLPTGRVKSALERGSGLEREFEDLLGTATRQGELSRKLRFNYGQADGRAVTSPPKLMPPPADLGTQTAADNAEVSGG